MLSDQEIEEVRSWLEPLIGPTKAEWYAEACRVEYGDDHFTILWSCRVRELARDAGRYLGLAVASLELSQEEIRKELEAMGIDVQPALEKVREDIRKAKEATKEKPCDRSPK